MLFNFKNLMIETTRRCNMHCAHCMRGNAQELDINTDVLQQLFKSTSHIKHLTITGGEPSLNPTAIRFVSYYARNFGCNIDSFFCATNAKIYSQEFVDALNELYSYCSIKSECALSVSLDQFHSKHDPDALDKYRELPYYNPVNEKTFLRRADILSEGRANENDLGRFSMPFSDFFYDIDFDGFYLDIGDRVYINAHGEVLLDGDLSYENQANERLGCLLETPLDEIIMNYHYEIPEHWGVGKDTVYCIHICAQEDTIANVPLEDNRYFVHAHKAMAAYKSLLTNIRITPVNPECGKIPDDLDLCFIDLPEEKNRCIGTIINYKIPGRQVPKQVKVEILRCKLEEGF